MQAGREVGVLRGRAVRWEGCTRALAGAPGGGGGVLGGREEREAGAGREAGWNQVGLTCSGGVAAGVDRAGQHRTADEAGMTP